MALRLPARAARGLRRTLPPTPAGEAPPSVFWALAWPSLQYRTLIGLPWLASGSDGEFFFELLLLGEGGVVAIAGDEFVVRTQFGDAAGNEHCDPVGVAGGGDAVR